MNKFVQAIALAKDKQTNKPTEHESRATEQRKREIRNGIEASFVLMSPFLCND